MSTPARAIRPSASSGRNECAEQFAGGSSDSSDHTGGGRPRGVRAATGVNLDPELQADLKLREINAQPDMPGSREEVFCTKIGTTHPEEMYIVGAHMDGHGYGEAANDDGSGTALVMELARVFSSPDVQTDRSFVSFSGTTKRLDIREA
jgi:hypothetical protein